MNEGSVHRQTGLFVWLVMAAVAVLATTVTLLFAMQISGAMLAEILPTVPTVGGVDPTEVVSRFGPAWTVAGLAILVVPLAVGARLLVGGGSEPKRRQRKPR